MAFLPLNYLPRGASGRDSDPSFHVFEDEKLACLVAPPAGGSLTSSAWPIAGLSKARRRVRPRLDFFMSSLLVLFSCQRPVLFFRASILANPCWVVKRFFFSARKKFGAGGGNRTPNLRFTKPLHYHCATPAMAPEAGLEPATERLTAACTTIMLLWIAEKYMEPEAYSTRFHDSSNLNLITFRLER